MDCDHILIKFSFCPTCGEKLPAPSSAYPRIIKGRPILPLPTHVTRKVGRHSDDTPTPGYQPDVYPDNEDHWRRQDFERWATTYWNHLHGRDPDFTRHAQSYADNELSEWWRGWVFHTNLVRFGEGGDDQGRDQLRQRVFEHFEQYLSAAERERPSGYGLGYLHGQLISYAMAGVITKQEYDAFQDRFDALGIGSRMKIE